MLLFVYGTLKKGQRNHKPYLEGRGTFIGSGTIPGFILHEIDCPGVSIPFIIPNKQGGLVHGELYSLIDDKYIEDIRKLEMGYEEVPVSVKVGNMQYKAVVFACTDEDMIKSISQYPINMTGVF